MIHYREYIQIIFRYTSNSLNKKETSEKSLHILALPLNTVGNPYCNLLYSEVIKQGTSVRPYSFFKACFGNYKIWHIHWPDHYINRRLLGISLSPLCLMVFILNLLICRLKKIRIIWTVHNLTPHERINSWISGLFYRLFTQNVAGCIYMTKSSKSKALQAYPILEQKKWRIIPHGHYRDIYPNTVSKKEAREFLNIPQEVSVVGFIGQIRPYKNLPSLIHAFKKIESPPARLIIAGNAYCAQTRNKILNLIKNDQRIAFHDKFIPVEKLQYYLNSFDLVALPFTEILNSGSAILAVSFNKPVLVPNKEVFLDFKSLIGSDWIYTFEDELDSKQLNFALESVRYREENRKPNLDSLSWPKLSKMTIDFYNHVVFG